MLSVTRFLFLIVAACSLSATVVLAQAPAKKTKHVGYLVWSSPGARGSLEQSLLDGMKQEGYVEGKNLLVERRYVDGGTLDEVRAAARELAALNLDAIVSTCSVSSFFKRARAVVPCKGAYFSSRLRSWRIRKSINRLHTLQYPSK